MKRLIIVAALVAVFLTSTVSFAGDTLGSSDMSFLFNNAKDVAVSVLDQNEISATQGESIIIALGFIIISLF